MATWRDFRRPADADYYETRFSYLSQGDILLDAPLLLVPPVLDAQPSDAGPVVTLPVLAAPGMVITPTCDFRRSSADHLDAHPDEEPYQLRQQLVVARIVPLHECERSQPPEGRSDRVAQLRSHDNLRQYMYLPELPPLVESLIDLGTLWTLPIGIVRRLDRLTQLTETGARQLQYKLAMYGTAVVIDRESLGRPID